MEIVAWHKTFRLIVFIYCQEVTGMAFWVHISQNGNVEGETRHVVDAMNGTLDVILHTDGVQGVGNV